MSLSSSRFLALARLGAVSLPALAVAISEEVSAQTALPGIVVTAPSPIVHHTRPTWTPPARTARRGTTTPPSAARPPEVVNTAAPAVPSDLQGTLPIVTDQFATVTVVPNEEIRRNGAATLGDLLNNKPGITGSSFVPGASSRPIIRGLDVNRVGIVENGIGSNGTSDLGEDHFVPIDPLSTNQVEVIRGAANGFGHTHSTAGFKALTLGSIGVVYGDIGTSPLYALREAVVASGATGSVAGSQAVLGVLSLIL